MASLLKNFSQLSIPLSGNCIYLLALKELGCTVDFSKETPDFLVNSPSGEFVAEATTANHPDKFRPEWDKDIEFMAKTSREDVLRLSTIRLVNAISAKHKKYVEKYSKLSYVQNKPFVICASPFDQPFFFMQDSLAIVRVLYAYEEALTIPGGENEPPIFVGDSRCYKVQKKPGVDIDLGLFTDNRMADVSAVIFNNRATFSKVRALAKEGETPVIFSGGRMVKTSDSIGIQPFLEKRPDYEETILDGLHILVNPFAKHPLDLQMFADREVSFHNYDPESDHYLSAIPDGFLLQRMCQSVTTEDHNVKFKKSVTDYPYQELPSEVWNEDELIYVGGNSGPFKDNHMAHYRGWTILVSLCSIDEDWGTQAVDRLCYNVPQYRSANMDDAALALVNTWFSTKEEAYEAIKQEIDSRHSGSDT